MYNYDNTRNNYCNSEAYYCNFRFKNYLGKQSFLLGAGDEL